MNINRKQKLVEYLYPTEEVMNFMCNDLYQELLQNVSQASCISSKNLVKSVRDKNLQHVKNQILAFVQNNGEYANILFDYYKSTNLNKIIDDILIGLVFYVANTTERFCRLDIFNDKKSICYNKMSILNFI